jgi:non-heme chloroperoxidase
MASITEHEAGQVETANASGRMPVVFIHGLWLLASSWEPWAAAFEAAGYAPVCPGWPDDPATVEEARKAPQVLAGKGVGQVADHMAAVVGALDRKPAIIGHSFGGLLAQILAARGLAAVTVAINPAPFRGILALPPAAIRSTFPVLANPLNRGRAVTLSFDQFQYSWANGPGAAEARRVYDRFHVAAPGKPIFQAAVENLNPATELRVDTRAADRGPLLIFTGGVDHAVPPAMSRAAYKKQSRNPGVTEHIELPDRGHSLVIDDGWREVCDASLDFVGRFEGGTSV